METVGLIGAGLMGRGIAKNILEAGYQMVVHKRRIDESDPHVGRLRSLGAEITGDLGRVFRAARVLATCLPTSVEVEQVLIGPHGLSGTEGAAVRTVLDFTTARPDSTRKIHGILAERGIDLLDTPMTGGPPQAEAGELSLAVGGDEQVAARADALMRSVAKNVVYAGPAGAGNALKLMNNFFGILDRCVTAAACVLAEKADIPLQKLLDFVSVSGGYSRGFESEIRAVMEGDFELSFALELSLKDLRYMRELFASQGLELSVLNELAGLFERAADSGYAKRDVKAIYEYLKGAMNG